MVAWCFRDSGDHRGGAVEVGQMLHFPSGVGRFLLRRGSVEIDLGPDSKEVFVDSVGGVVQALRCGASVPFRMGLRDGGHSRRQFEDLLWE